MGLRHRFIALSAALAALVSTSAAHAVIIDTTNAGLYAFDTGGTGPFPSIDLLLSCTAFLDTFTSGESLQF
jgi:hypothetical protein